MKKLTIGGDDYSGLESKVVIAKIYLIYYNKCMKTLCPVPNNVPAWRRIFTQPRFSIKKNFLSQEQIALTKNLFQILKDHQKQK